MNWGLHANLLQLALHICYVIILKMIKHLACVDITLFLFPDVIFCLTPNYPDLVESEYGPGNTHGHFSFGLYKRFEGGEGRLMKRVFFLHS